MGDSEGGRDRGRQKVIERGRRTDRQTDRLTGRQRDRDIETDKYYTFTANGLVSSSF